MPLHAYNPRSNKYRELPLPGEIPENDYGIKFDHWYEPSFISSGFAPGEMMNALVLRLAKYFNKTQKFGPYFIEQDQTHSLWSLNIIFLDPQDAERFKQDWAADFTNGNFRENKAAETRNHAIDAIRTRSHFNAQDERLSKRYARTIEGQSSRIRIEPTAYRGGATVIDFKPRPPRP